MKRSLALPVNIVSLLFLTFLSAGLVAPMYAYGQQNMGPGSGVIDDWTQHHIVFSNPGSEADAIRAGKHAAWLRIVSDPRYRAQWLKRYGAQTVTTSGGTPELQAGNLRDSREHNPKPKKGDDSGGLWIATLNNGNVSLDMYPAKYTFSTSATPSCSDFVVFPNNSTGAQYSNPNIVGLNNLYATTCGTPSGSPTQPPPIPSYYFAYYVGGGVVQTSPVLSENGTKVAFVESITGNGTSTGSKFHVVTIGTTGTLYGNTSSASPVNPCTTYSNGTMSSTCLPGVTNNAVDVNVLMSGDVSVTRSSPFVDYTHDVAYVGDDNGKLHKFTGVFNTTPPTTLMTEVVNTTWPASVAPTGTILTGPTYDSVSGNIFVGGSNGVLYCINSTTGASCGSVTVGSGGTGGGILDAPIVDSTEQTVFAEANNFMASCPVIGGTGTVTGCAMLTQVTTSMTNQVNVNMGYASSTSSSTYTDLYDGAFGNIYLTTHTGYMYFCGTLASAATPALWRVAITNGVMANANDGTPIQLVETGSQYTGTSADCSPLTEFYNVNGNTSTTPPTPADFLFVGIKNYANASACAYNECLNVFDITASFPIPVAAGLPLAGGGKGTSGMVVDNNSTTTGASQIYFGNLNSNDAEQVSQAGLQ